MIADGTEDVRKQLSAIKYSEDADDVKKEKYKAYFEGTVPSGG